MLQLVYAYSPTKTVENKNEFAFGLNGDLPWPRIGKDMKNFAFRTAGSVLICGAKTFMSFRAPLPGRKCIVVQDMSRPFAAAKNGELADCYISDLEFTGFLGGDILVGLAGDDTPTTFSPHASGDYSVIGGAAILAKALLYADKIVATTIRKKHRVNSDVQLEHSFIMYPMWEESNFRAIEMNWSYIDELTNISEDVFIKIKD